MALVQESVKRRSYLED